jgi:hypothetical protein
MGTIWVQGALCDQVETRIIVVKSPADMDIRQLADCFWAMIINSDMSPYRTNIPRLELVFGLSSVTLDPKSSQTQPICPPAYGLSCLSCVLQSG